MNLLGVYHFKTPHTYKGGNKWQHQQMQWKHLTELSHGIIKAFTSTWIEQNKNMKLESHVSKLCFSSKKVLDLNKLKIEFQ